MGVGNGVNTNNISGNVIDGYIKNATVILTKLEDSVTSLAQTTTNELGYWSLSGFLPTLFANQQDNFFIYVTGGTDISTNKQFTETLYYAINYDMVANNAALESWCNIDIITTIASYSIIQNQNQNESINTLIENTYTKLGLTNSYAEDDFISQHDIEKATKTQQLEALVYILKNLYTAIGYEIVLSAIALSLPDQNLDFIYFPVETIKKIQENMITVYKGYFPAANIQFDEGNATNVANLIKQVTGEINGVNTLADLDPQEQPQVDKNADFKTRYSQTIQFTEAIKNMVDNEEILLKDNLNNLDQTTINSAISSGKSQAQSITLYKIFKTD